MKIKKTLKIVSGLILFFTLPSLILFGFVYYKYNEDLPTGIKGPQADALATKMLDALNYEAYQNTSYIEWTFRNKHHYKWKKNDYECTVYWENYKVTLNLNDTSKSVVYVHNFKAPNDKAPELINKAIDYFNNDSFWLVAPYKVFDKGTERSVVTLDNGEQALLVTYTSGGSTPGDSYLWFFDSTGKPKSFKMWTSILPIDGLEATWSDWTTGESGVQLPTFHKLLFLGLKIGNIKAK